jgi:hypothetical protein
MPLVFRCYVSISDGHGLFASAAAVRPERLFSTLPTRDKQRAYLRGGIPNTVKTNSPPELLLASRDCSRLRGKPEVIGSRRPIVRNLDCLSPLACVVGVPECDL